MLLFVFRNDAVIRKMLSNISKKKEVSNNDVKMFRRLFGRFIDFIYVSSDYIVCLSLFIREKFHVLGNDPWPSD